jgi:uncharacterized protein YdaU (DUF1376 family)
MTTSHYMPFYLSDYLSDTMHLSTLENGAYLLLIIAYWQTGGALPDNDEYLAVVTRLSKKRFQKIKQTLKNFFQIKDSFWFHNRIEKELEKFREKSYKSRISGLKSAEKRWGSGVTNVITNAKQTLNERYNESVTISESYTDPEEKKKPKPIGLVKKENLNKPLPDDFRVTDHHRELARKNGWPSPDGEFDAFCDHHVARGNKFADWDRAFYTWLRNSKQFKKPPTPTKPAASSAWYEYERPAYEGLIE